MIAAINIFNLWSIRAVDCSSRGVDTKPLTKLSHEQGIVVLPTFASQLIEMELLLTTKSPHPK